MILEGVIISKLKLRITAPVDVHVNHTIATIHHQRSRLQRQWQQLLRNHRQKKQS